MEYKVKCLLLEFYWYEVSNHLHRFQVIESFKLQLAWPFIMEIIIILLSLSITHGQLKWAYLLLIRFFFRSNLQWRLHSWDYAGYPSHKQEILSTSYVLVWFNFVVIFLLSSLLLTSFPLILIYHQSRLPLIFSKKKLLVFFFKHQNFKYSRSVIEFNGMYAFTY